MFYGGRLLSHLSADESVNKELIQLLPMNRHCAILLDSDLGSPNQSLRDTKSRVISEVDKNDGFSWVTAGREIENYYSSKDRDEAIRFVHKSVTKTNLGGNRYSRPLAYWRSGETEERTANKIAVAEWLIANKEPDWHSLELGETLQKLTDFIRKANT
jgi:hypothetical protein